MPAISTKLYANVWNNVETYVKLTNQLKFLLCNEIIRKVLFIFGLTFDFQTAFVDCSQLIFTGKSWLKLVTYMHEVNQPKVKP